MFVSCSRRRLTPLCTFGSKTADSWNPPTLLLMQISSFRISYQLSFILPPFLTLLWTYISLMHISLLLNTIIAEESSLSGSLKGGCLRQRLARQG